MPAPSPDSPAPGDGLFARLAALLGSALAYLRARTELAGIEGKEAATNYAIILALAIGALIVIVFGYFFLVIAIVFLIALAFGGGNAWIWVMLGAALFHLIGAAVLALVAKNRLSRPMFGATLDEFRKDQEWLTKRANPN